MRITDVSIEFVLVDGKTGLVINDEDFGGELIFGSYEQAAYERRVYMQKEGFVKEGDVQMRMILNGHVEMGTVCIP
jgi:hypothetical protein